MVSQALECPGLEEQIPRSSFYIALCESSRSSRGVQHSAPQHASVP